MPIKQERMLSLISSAEDFRAALDRAKEIVKIEVEAHRAGKISAEEALSNIELFIEPSLMLTNPIDSHLALEIEKERFKPAKIKANQGAAKRAARSRQRADLEDYASSGDTVAKLIEQTSEDDDLIEDIGGVLKEKQFNGH